MTQVIMGHRFDSLVEKGKAVFTGTFGFDLDLPAHTERTRSASFKMGGSDTASSSGMTECEPTDPIKKERSDSQVEVDLSAVKMVEDDGQKETSCMTISIYSAVVIGLICVFLVLGRDYIKYLLLSLENSSLWISFVIFALLFTVVSFPMTWGYILLNIAAGYLYGLYLGIAIILVCALLGLFTAHTVVRRFLGGFVRKRLLNDNIRAIMRVVESDQGFRIVFLARLTPIPFGLQNALFAISKITTTRYLSASLIGMFPTQGMHAYIGSTLRSMEEVISSSSNSLTAQLIFIAQILFAIVLLMFVIRRAKVELSKTVNEAEASASCMKDQLSPNGYVITEIKQDLFTSNLPNGVILPPLETLPTHKRSSSLQLHLLGSSDSKLEEKQS